MVTFTVLPEARARQNTVLSRCRLIAPKNLFRCFSVCVSFQTDYFHLFLCVAIIVLYGEDVTEQQLATDQMLLHFSNLSMHMNGELVLRKVSSISRLYNSSSWGSIIYSHDGVSTGYLSAVCCCGGVYVVFASSSPAQCCSSDIV